MPWFVLRYCTNNTRNTAKFKGITFHRSFVLDLTTVNTKDIRAKYMYRSYAGFRAEKYRQFSEYPLSIHPFSKLRLWVELIVSASIIFSIILKPIQFSSTRPAEDDAVNRILWASNLIFIINCIANILTGYVYGENHQHVVLDKKRIFLKYAVSWMIIDVLGVFSVITCYFSTVPFLLTFEVALATMGMLKIPILYKYVGNMCQVASLGMPAKTAVQLTLCLTSYLASNVVFQFSIEYLREDSLSPVDPSPESWMTQANLWNATTTIRFLYALERAVGMLRQNSNLNSLESNGSIEIFFIVAWLVSKVMVLHCTFKFMLAILCCDSARAKYYLMSQQVQAYVDQRRLPARIKEKILKFYAIRYQSHFFVESRMMACVSGQLRDDMIMFAARQLVQEVEFLKELPRDLLLQITLKFKLVIFIEGDIIFKINTLGDNLYFISKGTVATYSRLGREISHLEDGDYFGEVALVMNNRFRQSSAVALTNCELFSLTREDFESVACYPTVYEKIKQSATSRMEQMSVLDEQFKSQMRVLGESDKRNKGLNTEMTSCTDPKWDALQSV